MHLLSIPTTVFVIPDMIVESENNVQIYLIYLHLYAMQLLITLILVYDCKVRFKYNYQDGTIVKKKREHYILIGIGP